ncbi:DUF2927 domain-containing protein [Marivivens sp. LCG002]|uniref:DUF2927 domain-containing protein n=1 Tax=Marivivens sp. LCG002 TaxID=3051171 RepID=UPI00255313BD|nr:DUF2927 domain-containing protein [Marivivens sp. LCG002]WIV51520.1 DUF2927 domain-containing protein [Marivivens sp. LCG002]
MRTGANIAGLTLGLLLGACTMLPSQTPPIEPLPSTIAPQADDAFDDEFAPAPTGASEELAVYYRRWQQDQLTQGLLRTDGGGPDTPFTDTQLANNFVRIALFDEYVARGGDLKAQATLSKLRRWETPIRMRLAFGDTVPSQIRAKDYGSVQSYAKRLSDLTGVPISFGASAQNANFHVYIVNEEDRLGLGPELNQIAPGLSESTVRYTLNLPKDQLCLVIGIFKADGVTYDRAVAIIRGEHPDLLRLTCVHEELAQGMGLANDYSRASPSIFNDNEEFGTLTRHDEFLLKMLYDKRFRTGMTAAEAAPIAREIARELMAETTM